MEAADIGASDGSIVIDQLWKRRLQKALDEEPIAASLKEAVKSLPDIDQDDLEAIIEGQSEAWGDELHLPEGRFRLPIWYPVDYAVAIHIYTRQDPNVYSPLGAALHDPNRGNGPGGVSEDVSADVSAGVVAALRMLNFNDLGSHVAKNLPAIRARENAAEIEHPYFAERRLRPFSCIRHSAVSHS